MSMLLDTESMRILFLCHRFPYPPSGGAQIRALHMIRHLQERHRVTVGSLVRSPEEADAAAGLAEHCERYFHARVSKAAAVARMVARLPTSTPSSMGYFFSPELKRWIHDELERESVDLILTYCSSMGPYVDSVTGVPKMLDFVDMDSQKWLAYATRARFPFSLGYRLEGRKLERAEAALARKFDLCTTATAAEDAALRRLAPDANSGWFPNGVDFDYFTPGEQRYDPDEVVFLGRMNYYPNSDAMIRFVEDVMPLLRQRRPTVKLTIVGADPTPAVRRLAREPGVAVTGSVPDIRPYLRRAAVTVAPLSIARGTQNKILESLAARVPVICSRLAAQGVDAVDGKHLLAAERAQEYADAVLRLLESPAERERFAEAGRARARACHSWDAAMARMDALIASVCPAGATA